MASMSEHERRIRQARLLVSPPEVVYEQLKKYGESAADDILVEDREMEKCLLSREEPLINLGLASYGTDRDIVGELYRSGLAEAATVLDAQYRQGLRIGCLSNRAVYNLWGFPRIIIGDEET